MAENNMFSWIPALQQFAQFNMQVAEHMEIIKKKREEEEKQATGMQVVSDMAKNLQNTEFTSEEDMVKGYTKMLNELYNTKNQYAIQHGVQVLPNVFEMKRGILKEQKEKQGYATFTALSADNTKVDYDPNTPGIQIGTKGQLLGIIEQNPEYQKLKAINPKLAADWAVKAFENATYKTKGVFSNADNIMNYSKIEGTANDPNSIKVKENKRYKLSTQGIHDLKTGKLITNYAEEFGEDAPEAQKSYEEYLMNITKRVQLNKLYKESPPEMIRVLVKGVPTYVYQEGKELYRAGSNTKLDWEDITPIEKENKKEVSLTDKMLSIIGTKTFIDVKRDSDLKEDFDKFIGKETNGIIEAEDLVNYIAELKNREYSSDYSDKEKKKATKILEFLRTAYPEKNKTTVKLLEDLWTNNRFNTTYGVPSDSIRKAISREIK